MNINPIDFNYIDGTNSYPIQDYIDEEINNLLTKEIYTSNIIVDSSHKLNDLVFYDTSNLIIKNNVGGVIGFKNYLNYANNSNISTVIDVYGKLKVYHNYNLLQPTFIEGYYDVEGEILQLKADGVSTDLQLTALEAGAVYLQEQITTNLDLVNTAQYQVNELMHGLGNIKSIEQFKALSEDGNIARASQEFTELLGSARERADNLYQKSLSRGLLFGTLFGLGGAVVGYLSYEREKNFASNILHRNSNLTQVEKDTVYDSNPNIYSDLSNIQNFNNSLLNLQTAQGFINSNILTTQKIPNITTSNIIVNNTGSTTYSTINFSNATNNSAGYIGLGGIVSGYHNNNMVYNTPKAHIFNVPGQNSLSIPALSINASACVGVNINPSAYPLYRFSVDGDVYIHNASLRTNSIIYNSVELSSTLNNYLLKSGGTMTGSLTTNSIIYNSQELSTTLNNYLLLSGGTLTDTIIFNTGLFDNPSPSPLGFNGDRIVLQAGIGTNGYPYSIGINTNVFWFSSPSTSSYKFYSGAINTATLNNTGLLTLPSISATTSITTPSIIYNSQELSTTLTNYLLKDGGTMNGRIVFNTGYYQDPSPTGFGDRIVLQSGGLGYPYSVGINTDVFWHSAPSTASYKFYSGAINTATLNNTGLLTLPSINATTSITTPSIIYGGAELNTTLGNYLLKSGGTMTGQLAITANSASSLISLTNTGTVGQGILQTNNLGGYARLTYYNSGAGGYYTGNYVLEASSNNACIVLNTGGNNSNSIPRIILLASGNVGIGISNPSAKLEVNGKIGCIGTLNCWSNVGIGATNPYTLLHVRGTNPALTIMAQGGAGATSTINLSTYDHTTNSTNCALIATDNGNFGSTFQIRQKLAGADTNGLFTSFIMNVDGNVGIGTTTYASIKLYVNGKTRFEDVVTYTTGAWNLSKDGVYRTHYGNNAASYYSCGNSTEAHYFMKSATQGYNPICIMYNSGDIITYGNLSSGTNSYVYAGAMRIGGWDANSLYNGFRDLGLTVDIGKSINFNIWGGNGTITSISNNNVVMNTLTRSRNYFNRGETLNYSASWNGYNAGGWYWMTNGYWQDISTVSYLCVAITCLGQNAVWFGRMFLGQGGGFYQTICDMRNPNGGTNTIDVYDIWGSTGQNAIRITINNGTYGGQFNIKISG